MAPRVKVTRDEIVNVSMALVRERGCDALNARSIAQKLGCSTQPIFSNFSSLEEVVEQTRACAHRAYLGYIANEVASGKYPAYKAYGMAYIRFAKEEKELFKFLFMCDQAEAGLEKPVKVTEDFSASVEMIMQANGICREKAEKMHLEMWCFVHGIGTMLATSFFALDWESISQMISDIYHGLQAIYVTSEEAKL